MKNISILRSFLFNSGGSIVYLLSLWILTILVVKLANGYSDAGNLALAISITNIFKVFATFSIRNYQVSDLKSEYSDGIYVSSRIVTVIISLFLCFCYTLFFVDTWYQRGIVMTFMLFIGFESFIDVLNGIEQKYGKLDYAGLSLGFRGIIILLTFSVIFQSFGLFFSILGFSFSTLVFSLFYDIKKSRYLSRFNLNFNFNKICQLLKVCFPIALQGILVACLLSLPKNALELMEGTDSLGIFNSVTMPAFAIQVFSYFIFAPVINILANYFISKKYNQFRKLFLFIFFMIIFCCVILYVLANIFGDLILIRLFNKEIAKHAYLLKGAMIASSLVAIDVYLVTILTIFRKLFVILISHIIAFSVCVCFINYFIYFYGLNGVNLVQIFCLSIVCAIQLIVGLNFILAKHKFINSI
ncbi:MAG: hypothetical protein LBP22_02420 [Deltaproteobacteria bacterium]|jgi:O-antigen/teichoic acid export membrane protein|nr:hypothetical protein [Deltaproteobacteria bacterium]